MIITMKVELQAGVSVAGMEPRRYFPVRGPGAGKIQFAY